MPETFEVFFWDPVVPSEKVMCSTLFCRCQEAPVVPSEVRYDWIPKGFYMLVEKSVQ